MREKFYLVGFREDDDTIILLGNEFSDDILPLSIRSAIKNRKHWGRRAKIFEIKETRIDI